MKTKKTSQNRIPNMEFPETGFQLKYLLRLLESTRNSLVNFQGAFFRLNLTERLRIIHALYPKPKEMEHQTRLPHNFERIMEEAYSEEYSDISYCSNQILKDLKSRAVHLPTNFNQNFIIEPIRKKLKKIQKAIELTYEKVNVLKDMFSLEQDEIELVLFLYTIYNCRDGDTLLPGLTEMKLADFLKNASNATGVKPSSVKKYLTKNSKLFNSGIISEISQGKHAELFEVSEAVSEYLAGIGGLSLMEKFIKLDRNPVLPLEYFSIKKESNEIIIDLFKSDKPVNIFLYGVAGTGKTEYARAIGKATGKKVYHLQFGDNSDRFSRSFNDRQFALRVAANSINPHQGILIADESDFLLNTGYMFMQRKDSMEKGFLNNFLEESQAQIIWISNEIGYMEDSTLRRFSYSLFFKEMSMRDREMIWKNILKNHPLKNAITEDMIQRLSYDYRINAGGIASALHSASSIITNFKNKDTKNKDIIEKTLRNILEKHEMLIRGTFLQKKKTLDLSKEYDFSALNTNQDLEQIVESAKQFMELWRNESVIDSPLTMLFWGRPGTGKTEFAKYLSTTIHCKLLVKRASDLLSPYVGETEQKIAAAFMEAEDNQSILLIDEADTFLINRETAVRSWESSMTNEFLTQMENFKGILICSTNMLNNIDHAALRRFFWKIEFKSLKPEGVLKIYQKFFPTVKKELTTAEIKRLKNIDKLTPGDFKAVARKFSYKSLQDTTHQEIISSLEIEVKYKPDAHTGKIGF